MTMPAHAESRRRNLGNVLRLVHDGGPTRQVDISDRLGLTRSTGISLVEELVDLGFVQELAVEPTGQRGRPSPLIAASGDVVTVAVEVAAQTARVDIVALGGQLVTGVDLPISPAALGPTATLRRVAAQVVDLLDERPGLRVSGVAVAVHGAVDKDRRVVFAPNLGWEGSDLGVLDDMLATSLRPSQVPAIVVGNDADFGVIGEARRGGGRGHRDLLYLSAERGVGGGVVVNGDLVLGASGLAGEVGHMKIGGGANTCGCGQVGCWETEIGTAALERTGSTTATVATWLGRGLGMLIPVLQPGLVILGGHLARLWSDARVSVEEAIADACPARLREGVEIVPSRLGQDAALIGAAEVAFEPLLDDPARATNRRGPALTSLPCQ